MSTSGTEADAALDRKCPIIDGRHEFQRVSARSSDVGGIPVARLLPHRQRRLIGAWCFLDHAGPASFDDGQPGLIVGPHPHTCLQTFTWMIAGEVLHRDSLGCEQIIRPGQVNLMTAGHGISHIEETVPGCNTLHAAQLWIALPHAERFTAPRFDHYPELPEFGLGKLAATLLVGEYAGFRAPTLSFSPLIAMDLQWRGSGQNALELRPEFEYGILPLEGGGLHLDGSALAIDELAYLGQQRDSIRLDYSGSGRALLIGGEPLDAEITIWWNFVAHSKADIERAQKDWIGGDPRFGDIRDARGRRLEPPPIPWRRESGD